MVTIEQLSSGVFADMFELQGLVARAVYDGAAIYGDHNLELPALHSLESMVVVHTRFNSKSGHALQAQVSVPLHARYPRLSLDGHAVVDIKFPSLLFQCSCKGNPQHASIVASLTALFSMVGVVILWVVSMRSYKSHKTKVA
ncbi:hypothetical protein GOP47_0013712 [Adiantum capillus-veneris]|uniref:Uncharacterized protein n=1 Tax=Adiantum capillus-veneris TaxID=13818 RepID=A0A9D4UPR3_ADICA|nr:hypothetical protein GOP47_0013712 [Adiantum capillus-veneris]